MNSTSSTKSPFSQRPIQHSFRQPNSSNRHRRRVVTLAKEASHLWEAIPTQREPEDHLQAIRRKVASLRSSPQLIRIR